MQASRDRLSHDFSEAEKAYRHALRSEPKSAGAMVGMAWVRNSEHRFREGRRWALEALERDPGLQHAHALLGDGAMELGDYDEAYVHIQKALDLRADLSSLGRASQLLWITGKPEDGRELMERAIEAGGPFPENIAWCRAELGLMCFHEGDMARALHEADLALALAPENPRVLNLVGRLRASEGRRVEAITHYSKSADITPTHEAIAALAELHALNGDDKRYRKEVARLRAFHHNHGGHGADGHGHSHGHGHGSFDLARFLADRDIDLGEALHQAEHAYRDSPNIRAADALAWCLFKSGKSEEALRFSEISLKWNTPLPELHFHRGMILRSLGREEEATESLKTALGMNPEFDPSDAEIARQALK